MTVRVLEGDCRVVLPTLADASVQCCVTSPPYWGLRDYGTATWVGGRVDCDHLNYPGAATGNKGAVIVTPMRGTCSRCGATRIDSQIGLEESPEAYVASLVSVFREVRRVLRDDGTLWVVIGDSYAQGGSGGASDKSTLQNQGGTFIGPRPSQIILREKATTRKAPPGLKPKDLCGIPWMLAFALRADGWYLRSEIIWAKPNPMPESVTDRPTKSHEQIFLLTKSPTYYYDAAAIAEPVSESTNWTYPQPDKAARSGLTTNGMGASSLRAFTSSTRNRRTVWTVATQPYSGAHFATFPPALIEPCILAGSSNRACEHCGAAWVRVTEYGRVLSTGGSDKGARAMNLDTVDPNNNGRGAQGSYVTGNMVQREKITTGWAPSCSCPNNTGTARSVVLDPFAGAGTALMVADRLGRDAIGVELNPTYAAMARDRVRNDCPLFADVDGAQPAYDKTGTDL